TGAITPGNIAEFITSQRLIIGDIRDTNALKIHLEALFPKLSSIKYKLAVNKYVIQENSQIKDKDSVAIMPPFSGG
ncbi:MAG: molybdopterin synthase sulfur carrier subunit, partial [Flavobacterium sp.]